MKTLYKVKRNPLLIFLIFLLVLVSGAFVGVLLFESVEKSVFNLIGLSTKNEALKFLGIGMGGVLVALQALMSYKRAKAMEETASAQVKATGEQAESNRLTEQGQRQERLKNAIEHLGKKMDSVRMGGAYELFYLARDSNEMCEMVFEILCAHIRQTTSEKEYQESFGSKPSEEIQCLLHILFQLNPDVFKNLCANLSGTWLNGSDLFRANLKDAFLDDAYLQGACLTGANLQGAILDNSYVQRASFDHAHLQGASFEGAHMQGAVLDNAQLQAASLARAHLQEASLVETDLRGSRSDEAHIFSGKTMRELTESYGFVEVIEGAIGKMSDLSGAIFGGDLSQKDLDSFGQGLHEEIAKELRKNLKSHKDKPESHELPEDSSAIIGAYTEKEAERWIDEYENDVGSVGG